MSGPKVVTRMVAGQPIETFETWSDRANYIVATKYFQRINGALENSVPNLIARVVNVLCPKEEGINLYNIIANQEATFNSPVWFNLGVPGRDPQCSACFILPLDDSMESIAEWWKTEAMIFRLGSGSGVNLSNIRPKGAALSGGGHASGPLSFMGPSDAIAGSIKSGGMTRRSAKMMILNADHLDIYDFVWAKVEEEAKAQALIKAGFSGGMEGQAYSSVLYQNANLSVGVTNDFMQRALEDLEDGNGGGGLLQQIAEAAWTCGDPGLFFLDTINEMHTTPSAGPIRACNPCGEFLRPDGEACNLASINLMKFWDFEQNRFRIDRFEQVVRTMIRAMDTIVDLAAYPTSEIELNSRAYRPLGLGYSNLGALLMALGIPYDSHEGRDLAGAITSFMTAVAYEESIALTKLRGRMPGMTDGDAGAFLNVLRLHECSTNEFYDDLKPAKAVWLEACRSWGRVVAEAEDGYLPRNCQVTLLAPTGTISFMMDCDTTGIEPVYAHSVTKNLAGGGNLNMSTEWLIRQGYASTVPLYQDKFPLRVPEEFILDAPWAATAVGYNSIRPLAHVEMVAAVQPFLSGGVSKTVNLPNSATVQDVLDVYITAHNLGLKAVSVYRDGCKGVQAMVSTNADDKDEDNGRVAVRLRLPMTRRAETHKFSVGAVEGYLTAGFYDNGTLGEVFLRVTREGSTLSAILDAFATVVSLALQYGVPFQVIADKFIGSNFEPSGFTGNSNIPKASSILDYVFRYLSTPDIGRYNYPEEKELTKLTDMIVPPGIRKVHQEIAQEKALRINYYTEGHLCALCGSVMVQSGTCRTCPNCGETSGGC